MAQKFHPGDTVRIVNYGHPYWTTKEMWMYEEQFRVDWNNERLKLFFKDLPPAAFEIPRDKPDNILSEKGDRWTLDMLPQIVGREGIIIGSYADQRDAGKHGFAGGSRPDGENTYSISGIPEKQSWYDEAQLELVKAH